LNIDINFSVVLKCVSWSSLCRGWFGAVFWHWLDWLQLGLLECSVMNMVRVTCY